MIGQKIKILNRYETRHAEGEGIETERREEERQTKVRAMSAFTNLCLRTVWSAYI
jgi:hypothetical protein